MEQAGYLISAVTIGAIVLCAVVWRYLRLVGQRDPTLSVTLALIGFILVSSPLWASIVVKGPHLEVSLLKERSTKQAEQYLELVQAYQKALPPEKAQQVAPDVAQLSSSVEDLKKVRITEEQLKKLQEITEQAAKITGKIATIVP